MNDTESNTTIAWQPDMFGGPSKRTFAWVDLLMSKMREVGSRPDLDQTSWYKLIAGKTYSSIPAMRQAIQAIVKAKSVEYGLQIMEHFFTLKEVPAPDTMARQLRDGRKLLVDSGQLEVGAPTPHSPTFRELLTRAEGQAGHYNHGIKAQFGLVLRDRLSKFRWEENKRLQVGSIVVVPDFLCEQLCLAIEIDSWKFHRARDVFTADRKKARAMQYLGYYHLQFSGPELAIPGGMELAMQEIERFIERRCVGAQMA